MKTTLIMVIALLFPTITQAQHPWYGYSYGYSGADTARSANLRGFGQMLRGQANRLRALGTYQEKYQKSYSRYLDNVDKRIRNRWAIKDEAAKRKAARKAARHIRAGKSLDRMEEKMNLAERYHALKQRERDLREKGILPPKHTGFNWFGIHYESYAVFKLSPAYNNMIAKRDARLARDAIEKEIKEMRYQNAMSFLRMHRKMSYFGKRSFARLSPEKKIQYFREWEYPALRWERMKDDRNKRFYYARPELIHKAGKNGYPPFVITR